MTSETVHAPNYDDLSGLKDAIDSEYAKLEAVMPGVTRHLPTLGDQPLHPEVQEAMRLVAQQEKRGREGQ
jgi:hypothetical protein